MHTTQLAQTQLTRTYSSTHNLLHTNPSPSLFPFLLSPCHLYLSFAACWKKLTCGVIRSFNFSLQPWKVASRMSRHWSHFRHVHLLWVKAKRPKRPGNGAQFRGDHVKTANGELQKTQLQPPVGPSVASHPWLTTTNLSYRFPIFETSATALCGATGSNYSSHGAH